MKVKVTYGTLPAVSTPSSVLVPSQSCWGWEWMTHPDDTTQLHLVPLLDIHSHCSNPPCPCGAYVDPERGDRVIHHVAFDGRDEYEVGKRKHH